jgi:hypothetical protein
MAREKGDLCAVSEVIAEAVRLIGILKIFVPT